MNAATDEKAIHQNLDTALQHQRAGRLPQAIQIYEQILLAHPNHPVALNRMGVVTFRSGNRDGGIKLVQQAISVAPDFAKAHNNLGKMFQQTGKLFEAEISFRKSLSLTPNDADAHNNVGFVLQTLGKPEEAVENFRNAIAINPGNFIAHYNLGTASHSLGNHKDAIASYQQTLAKKPDFAAAHFSLHALLLDPGDMEPAIQSLRKALELEPSSLHFRFMLGMVLDYSGEAETFLDELTQSPAPVQANLDAWRYIKSAGDQLPRITGSAIEAFQIGIDAANSSGLVLEFGVRFGRSIRQISTLVDQDVHGFDSFEGLPEAWNDEPDGAYTTGGMIPDVPINVTLHKGWFDETLPSFVESHPEPVRLVNIDCDIYSSTITVLELLAKKIVHGTVIIFDEYIGGETWREDEYKAFQELVQKNGWQYEYLCFSFLTRQVAVRIV
jgi:tetratricopeptide (TPR) repeat protein